MRYYIIFGIIFCSLLTLSAQIAIEKVTYQHQQTELEGYLAYSTAHNDKRPGILIIHEWKGVSEHVKNTAQRLAKLGYVAFALDMYGKGVYAKDNKEASQLAKIYKSDRALMRSRAQAGWDILRKHAFVDTDKIAVIGYCFGGTSALELARSGIDLKGAVSFHGGLDTPSPQDAKNIKAKVLVLHGASDPLVPKTEITAFQKEMDGAKVDWQMVSYSGAVHSFTNPKANSKVAAYNKSADIRSWDDMLQFFTEIFAQSPAISAVPEKGSAIEPVLPGTKLPNIDLYDASGKAFNLTQQAQKHFLIMIYYRGGW